MYPRKQVETSGLGGPLGLTAGDHVQVTRVKYGNIVYLAMRRDIGPWQRVVGFPLHKKVWPAHIRSQMEWAVQWLQILSSNMLRGVEREKEHACLFPEQARWELQTVQDIEGNPLSDIARCIADEGRLKTYGLSGCMGMQYDWVLHLKIVPCED